jgi:hypothetical protein
MMDSKLFAATAACVLATGLIASSDANAVRMGDGDYAVHSECNEMRTEVNGVQLVSKLCWTVYEYVGTSQYQYDFDSMYEWGPMGGGSGWLMENMLDVPGAYWNGTVKVNRAGTKVVTTNYTCLGDNDATRQDVAMAAMGYAESKHPQTPFPQHQVIILNMQGGDNQMFWKTNAGPGVFVEPVPGTAGECKRQH